MASQFENYAQKGNLFIKQVADELGTPDDLDHASRVTRAVLYALRDTISIEESKDLIAQLPMVIKAVYVNGWNISKKRERYDTPQELLNAIYEHSGRTAGRDFGDNPRSKIRAVFKAITNYVSEGEMDHVKGRLPKQIAELLETEWP